MKAAHLIWILPAALALGLLAGRRLAPGEISRPVLDKEGSASVGTDPSSAAPPAPK